MSRLVVGDHVRTTGSKGRIGIIMDSGPSHGGVQYFVVRFEDGRTRTVPETDLKPYLADADPLENLRAGAVGGFMDFQRILTLERLVRENPLRNNIYAFNASRTNFYTYQFKPLLKLLDSPRHRLLIADEVGLGKTIEAGLILIELQARQELDKVLVVCPSNLAEKWQMELRTRFDERFELLASRDLLGWIAEEEDNPGREPIKGIVSLESIRASQVLEAIERVSPTFDLVIVDEAHHMRNFGRKQRKAGVLLSQCAETMIFLTATPIHLGDENLFSLLNILDEDEFPDFATVQTRFETNIPIVNAQVAVAQSPPNLPVVERDIDEASSSSFLQANPALPDARHALEELKHLNEGTPEFRQALLLLQRSLADLNLLGHIFTRTRKKEVQWKVPVRRAHALRLEFSPEENRFYLAVTEFVRAVAAERGYGNVVEQWILHMPQRRMASCIPAMVDYYKRRFDGSGTEEMPEDLGPPPDDLESDGTQSALGEARAKLKSIVDTWSDGSADTKYDRFRGALNELKAEHGSIKVVVFAFFKDTLRYLGRRLQEEGIGAVAIHGDVDKALRPELIKRFKTDPSVEVLLSSRVGSEGLDFQFADTLFNYDLPWNPMEVEQRIGRLDRIAQKSDVINIYNFWIQGTIEQRMLERLYERIQIFKRSVGELEIIIGDIITELERELFSKVLTPLEEQERLDQAAMSIERRMSDLEQLDRESARFIGTDAFFEEEMKSVVQFRRYVTGTQLRRFLLEFIKGICPETSLDYDEAKERGTIYPGERLREFIHRRGLSSSLRTWLIPGRRGVSVTFVSETAFQDTNCDFINVLHPLVRAAVDVMTEDRNSIPNAHHICLETDRLEPGYYLYFVYRLQIVAARTSNTLEMVVIDFEGRLTCIAEEAESLLAEMISAGMEPSGAPVSVSPDYLDTACSVADQSFLSAAKDLRMNIERHNELFLQRRLDSLSSYYSKKIESLNLQLEKGVKEGKDERYLRLTRSRIANLEDQFRIKRAELESFRDVEENHAKTAAGILEVVGTPAS